MYLKHTISKYKSQHGNNHLQNVFVLWDFVSGSIIHNTLENLSQGIHYDYYYYSAKKKLYRFELKCTTREKESRAQ